MKDDVTQKGNKTNTSVLFFFFSPLALNCYYQGYLFFLAIYIPQFKVDVHLAISSFLLFLLLGVEQIFFPLSLARALLLFYSPPLRPFIVTFLITLNVVGEQREGESERSKYGRRSIEHTHTHTHTHTYIYTKKKQDEDATTSASLYRSTTTSTHGQQSENKK